MKEKTLLILAAGLGSRYGGCKQIDGFGPNKEFIMDYSIYDAIESGFTKVVFLIKRDMLETIENTIAKRIKNKIKVEYAFQEMNNIPSGVIIPEDRVKPWGTAHAIYCCKDVIHEPFVMINADDFYGRESYKEISKYLDNIKSNNIGIVGYKAKNTMSELGSVKRGVCTVKNNKVRDIVESELRYTDGKIEARPLNGIEFHLIDDDTLVSMNMIAFDYSFLKYIDDNIKENMDLLENFATKDNVNQKRTASEIANILDMNESDANDLLIYYNSKHLDTKMSIKDFVNFMINEVSVDPNYGSSVDANTLASLKQLQPFINTNTINKQMTSNEIANTFGIDKSLVDQLFLFYRTTQDSKSTMTINEFANVALNMSNKDAYKDMFDESTIKSLNMLSTLSSEQIITNELDVSSMKTSLNNLGLSLDDNTMSLLYIYYTGYNTNSKLTLNGFANVALNMADQDAYKSYFSEDTKKSLQTIVTLNSYYDTVLPNTNLYSMFGIDAETGAKLNNKELGTKSEKRFNDKSLRLEVLLL